MDILVKMNISADSLLLRQPATMKEMEDDREAERFISPFSRTKEWTRSKSDGFFARLQTQLEKCGHPLKKV